MSNEAKAEVVLDKNLKPKELEKIKRLNDPIYRKFKHAGLVLRLCEGVGTGEERLLIFFSDVASIGKVGSVRASDFLAASDEEAVEMIELISKKS